ncbi:MAG: winged helix-turn-helix domain-containing protein [Candidatus Hermodarchaeota archaeon]
MMGNRELSGKKRNRSRIDEDELFRSLSHKIRRDIIKILGENPLSFSEVINNLENVDSPTLSYHLKSLQPYLQQKESKYELSGIGEVAFNLLS